MEVYGKLSINNQHHLNTGVSTSVEDEDGVYAIHYHLIGAPFTGLWKKKLTPNQKKKVEVKRLKKVDKRATTNPAMWAKRNEESWSFILNAKCCTEEDRQFVQQQNDSFIEAAVRAMMKRKIQAKQDYMAMRRMQDQQAVCRDTVVSNENESCEREWQKDLTQECVEPNPGPTPNDYISRFNELCQGKNILSYGELVSVTQYNERPGWRVDVSINVAGHSFIGSGSALQKKEAKQQACKIVLESYVTTFKPMVHMNKENTKRDSKRHKNIRNDREERLANSHPEIARKIKAKNEHNRLERIYAKQRRQNEIACDKMIARLELHSFSIPVKITFPQFKNITTKALNLIPKQIRDKVEWVDIFAACWTLINNRDYASQWLACRSLYTHFKIEGMSFVLFAANIFKLMKRFGLIGEIENPEVHAQMHYIESSPISIIVTLVLTILFRQDPRKNTVDRIVSSFKEVPSTSTGMEMVMNAAHKTFEYVTKSYDDEFSIEFRLNKLDARIKELISPKGQESLKTDKSLFEEISLMKVESLELARFIRANTCQGVLLNKLSFDINTLYSKAQILGASGHGYRKRPVVLHLNGTAGVGKTRLINYISADTISLILQLENDKYLKEEHRKELEEKVEHYDQYVYFRPVGLKYQQNFKSYTSKIYVCDDANQIIPAFQNGETTYPMELIHLNNSHDHMLNVAEIEKKADALFNSRLVIATDNIKTPDLYYMVCPEAYERRIDFSFEVTIKPQYCHTRIINGKPYYSVNLKHPDIKPGESNTFVYQFEDRHNIKYTYEEVIEMLEEKLLEVDEHHDRDVEVFKNRALERLTQRKFVLNNAVTHEMAAHFNENISTSSVHYRKDSDEVKIQNAEVHGVFGKMKKKIGRSIRNSYIKLQDATEDLVEGVSSVVEPPPRVITLKERFDDWTNEFQILMIAFLLRFFSVRTLDRWERKIRKTKDFIRDNRDMILATAGVFSALTLGYMYFRKPTTKTTNNPSKRRTNKTIQGKYDGGQPSKSAPKGKTPPKTPIKSVPISHSASEKETIHDIAAFLTKPDAHVACPRAYSMAKLLISNSYYIYAEYTRNKQKEVAGLRGFFIKDRIFVTNRHLLPTNAEEFKTVKFNLYNRFNEFENIRVDNVTINTFAHEDDQTNLYYDLIWIDFHKENMKSHADLTRFSKNNGCDNFVSEKEMSNLIGTKIIVCTLSIAAEIAQIDFKPSFTGKAAWYFEMQHTKITDVNSEAMECSGRDNEDLYTFKTMSYPMQSFPGYCGSVVIANDSEYPGKILGIHMAGYDVIDKSFGQLITKEMIESIGDLGVHMVKIEGKYNTLMKADEFTFLRTVPHTLRSPTKTKLRKSIFHNKIVTSSKEPAHLSNTPDGEHVINKSMRKYLTPHQTIALNSRSLFSSILHYKLSNTRKIRELNREISIKGIEGNQYICGINRKSSAGYPLNVETKKQGKHEYLGEGEEWILDHPRVEELIKEFTTSVHNNERPNIVFVATIKDELLKISKVEAYKSRAFAAAPLPYTILFREKYLDYFATIMEDKILNFSLVGVNMYSMDVDHIVNMLLEVAPRNSKQFLAGDFTNFDGTLNLNLLWKIYEFIEYRYGRTSKVCESLWNELVDSQQLFGNTVIHVARGQPSGNPATTLVNTLYNIGLCFMVLFEVMDEINTVDSYEVQENLVDYYRGVYYGDDNLHAFHKRIVNIMDPNLITHVMEKHGHIYTTDAKDTTHFEYRFLSEVSILKRHFAYDDVSNEWIAPLELVSIFEPINWDRVKDGHYDQKELQMKVNVRTAIRELSLHNMETFSTYVPKLLNECREYGLILEPECYFDQISLRKIIRNSDNLLFFNSNGKDVIKIDVMKSNDMFLQMEEVYNIDEDLELRNEKGTIIQLSECPKRKSLENSHSGITIQLGGRPGSNPPSDESSPLEDSQKPTCHLFNPTVNMNKWIANTYEEAQQNTNNKMTHINNGNFIFTGSGGNGAIVPFQIPAIEANSSVSITLSASANSERSGTVIITSDWFDIGARFEAQNVTTQQLTTFPRGVTNATAQITMPPNSTSVFVFTLNVSPLLPSNAVVAEPLWVTGYENPISTFAKPQMHMMRHHDPKSQNEDQRQIVTLDTVMRLKSETVPKQIELDMDKLAVMKEKRDHTIKNVLSRMYTIRDIELPPGGTSNDTIQIIDILSEFLTQNNVSAKLEGFTFLRTNFIITLLTRTLTTTSGGIIVSFYPQLPNLASRSANIMQASQTPNKRISVSGSEGIELKVPFISAFYGKNLVSGSGDIGQVVIKLLTPLNINATSLRVFIQADENDIEVTYPTFAAGPNARENIEQQIRMLQEKQQQLLSDARNRIVRVDDAQRLAQNVVRRMNLPDVVERPQVHMMKNSTKSNTISVKWQPASNHVNKDGEDIAHHLTLSRDNDMKTSQEFGTSMNEMTVDHIAKSKQIIALRRVTTAMAPGYVVYARPCSIVDFMSQDGEVSMTHQTWLSMMAQKWKSNLDFETTLYLTQFHAVTLTFIFNPGDQGEFQEGQILSYDLINKADRTIVEFDGQRSIANFEVKPTMNTALKSVPTARLGNITANALTWTNDCFSEECSYGMFYIAVEVRLKAAQSVAAFVDLTVDFSTQNLCLGDPIEFIPLVPSVHCNKARVHMDKAGLTTETAEVASAETRSEHFENPEVATDNVQDTTKTRTIVETMGDSITNIKDLLDTYTPFAPIKIVQNGQALAIETYAFRRLSDLAADDKFEHHDWIDYFSAGFAYYKGKINLRFGKVTGQMGPFGEINSTTRRNPVALFGSSSGTGLIVFPAPNPAKSGSRVVPLFKEECIPQINVPYYQPFHMSRITNSNNFNSANQPKIVIFRPYNTEQVRISRATDKDFHFGFLTALPTFQLVSGSIYD